MAYLIYLMMGNIPKDICHKLSHHAQILLGYIPTTKLMGIGSKATHHCALANLFHGCMRIVLDPISYHGEAGIPMMSSNGVWQWCHPILATFVGDYAKQALVTCTYNGHCPKCKVPQDHHGEYKTFPSYFQSTVIDTYLLAEGNPWVFHRACCDTGLKPIYYPFWEQLPLVDIFLSITLDILHQLLQGMMKHLIQWLTGVFGPSEFYACGMQTTRLTCARPD